VNDIPFVSPGTVTAAVFALPALTIVVLHARRHGLPAIALLARLGLIVVLATVLAYTMPRWNRTGLLPDEQTWNLIPLRTIRAQVAALGYDTRESLLQLAGNFLFFLPVGLLLPLGWRHLRSFGRALLVGLAITLAVELAQLLITRTLPVWPRWADIDDVLLNLGGVAAGWLLWRAFAGGRRSGAPSPGPGAA